MLSMYNKLIVAIFAKPCNNTLTFTNEVSGMSTSDYTQAQINALQAKPVTLAIARQFAADWNKSQGSVIRKASALGTYIPASKPSKAKSTAPAKMTKAELVRAIAASKKLSMADLAGLERAPAIALKTLLGAIS